MVNNCSFSKKICENIGNKNSHFRGKLENLENSHFLSAVNAQSIFVNIGITYQMWIVNEAFVDKLISTTENKHNFYWE